MPAPTLSPLMSRRRLLARTGGLAAMLEKNDMLNTSIAICVMEMIKGRGISMQVACYSEESCRGMVANLGMACISQCAMAQSSCRATVQ